MDKRTKNILLLICLIALFILTNYSFIDKKIEGLLIGDRIENAEVTRIVDGDTIKINNNDTIRFLGINTPEKGEKYYQEAKDFLVSLILNKTIKIERGKEDRDMYKRLLRYVFLDNKNINLEIVKNGLANFYFPEGRDIYYDEFEKAWEDCIKENKNLCKKSIDECSDCIELKELNVKEQKIIFYNKCFFSCGLTEWTIKDEGRKKFVFDSFILKSKNEVSVIVGNKTNSENVLFWRGKDYVWTSSGDSLFLRDERGDLVLWKSY